MLKNKQDFIGMLSSTGKYTYRQCEDLAYIFERNFMETDNSKERIIERIKGIIDVTAEEADDVYNDACGVIMMQIEKSKQ